MSILRMLMYLVPSRRRALERDMREELESLAAIAQAEETRSPVAAGSIPAWRASRTDPATALRFE